MPHGFDLGIGGDDTVDHGLLVLLLYFQLSQLLGQLFVGQFHIINIKLHPAIHPPSLSCISNQNQRKVKTIYFLPKQCWHIFIIKMDIHDYQNLLKPQPITSLQIHLYDGKDMIFTNTLLRQSAKLIAPNITPSFVVHANPVTTFGSPPFCILNQVHVKNQEELYKLVITLAELSQQQERQGEQRVAQQNSLLLHTVLRHYQELSQVATVLNEDDINPYWTLLNPILRLRHNRQIKLRKQKLYRSTQFFTKNELNADYFLHRLNVLEEYIDQLKKQKLNGLCIKFIKICQISLLKHTKENSQKIFKVLIEQPSLLQINQHKLTFLIDLQQYHQKAVQDKKQVAGVYGSFRLPGEAQPQPQKEEQYTTMNEKWVRALIKPGSATVLLFLMMFVIKK